MILQPADSAAGTEKNGKNDKNVYNGLIIDAVQYILCIERLFRPENFLVLQAGLPAFFVYTVQKFQKQKEKK